MSRAFGAMAILLTVMVTFGQAVDKAAVKCSTGKQKAAVKKIGSKLKCHQKANAAGLPVDQACLAKAEAKFSDTVTKIDAKGGCIVIGDEAVIEQAADVCVDAIRGLTPANPPTCGDGPYPQCGGTCPAGQACRPVLETKLTDGMGNGEGPTQSCGTVCNCVDPDLACDGAPCASLCMRDIHERNTPPTAWSPRSVAADAADTAVARSGTARIVAARGRAPSLRSAPRMEGASAVRRAAATSRYAGDDRSMRLATRHARRRRIGINVESPS